MMKLLILFALCITLLAKEQLYLHVPAPLPSSLVATSFGQALVDLLDNAQEEISFAIYGLKGQDAIFRALINAQTRGVRIKGVVDSDTHGKNYYSDTDLLYRHFDIVSDYRSTIMHNKFFIIDRRIVWTGSSNISDTGTGGYNANNAVVIEHEQIAGIYTKEFDQMFVAKKFHAKKETITHENIQTEDSLVCVYFSPRSDTYSAIKMRIEEAQRYLYIPIFYLTHKELTQKLIEAKDRGVEVKIILDATAARNPYSTHKILRQNGIEVKVENFGGKMHAKSLIIDDEYIISGSMNLTQAGNSKNDENTLIIKNPALALEYKRYFLQLWQEIPDVYLRIDPRPEGVESGNACSDGIDNDFDHRIDALDSQCKEDAM